MNLVLLDREDFIGPDRVCLSDRRHAHIRDVLAATKGMALRVGLIDGKIGTATVLDISADKVQLHVQLQQAPPQPLLTTLIMALPRPKVCRRVLQGVTSLGVKRIVLLNSWRVEKSYWHSPLLGPGHLRELLLLGLEQARDTVLPRIDIQQRFKPFVEDLLPSMARGSCGLVADPGATRACPANLRQPLTLAIGPEGGFTPYEVEKLERAGLNPVHLGPRPLRVETAIPALLGRLHPWV